MGEMGMSQRELGKLSPYTPHFKAPRFIRFVDEFPTTVTGKVQKFRMHELELERMQPEKAVR